MDVEKQDTLFRIVQTQIRNDKTYLTEERENLGNLGRESSTPILGKER